jgi:NAD-dependent deacetylase
LDKNIQNLIGKAAQAIRGAQRVTAFSGAGISVESNIPPFRGKNGLWNKYDPKFLEINYFMLHPKESWELIKEIIYDFFGKAKPNSAHYALALMEKKGFLQAVITQNIDNLHQEAGSENVYEFHGTSQKLVCLDCGRSYLINDMSLEKLPLLCSKCGGLIKPDFIFFGEPIPEPAASRSFMEAELSDVFIVIGSTGEVAPASQIPHLAKNNGALIIEINTEESGFTHSITDIFLKGKATEMMTALVKELKL